MNTAELDHAYKAFLKVRHEWIQTLYQYDEYSEATEPDALRRPVALCGAGDTAPVLARLKHLIVDWQRFHDLAEEYRANKVSPIPKSMYSPVPFIAPECDFVIVTSNPAANSVKWYVEKVIGLIRKQLAACERAMKSVKVDEIPALEDKIMMLEDDLARFSKFPTGTLLVRRQDGYADVRVSLKNKASAEDVKTPATIFDGFIELDLLRVGQYGCVIQEQALKYRLAIYEKTANNPSARNIYDSIRPIPCSVMSDNVSLYLADDVDEAKATIASKATANRKNMRPVYQHRTNQRAAANADKNAPQKPEPKPAVTRKRRVKLSELAIPLDD